MYHLHTLLKAHVLCLSLDFSYETRYDFDYWSYI